MLERFTDRARRATFLAQQEATGMGHGYIGTEHLLLGLLAEGEGVAAQSLKSMDVKEEAIRELIDDIIGRGTSATHMMPFTSRAKKVLELALQEASKLGHNYIGTEHLLLALVRDEPEMREGISGQILLRMNVDFNELRACIYTIMGTVAPASQLDVQSPKPRVIQGEMIMFTPEIITIIEEKGKDSPKFKSALADLLEAYAERLRTEIA